MNSREDQKRLRAMTQEFARQIDEYIVRAVLAERAHLRKVLREEFLTEALQVVRKEKKR